MKSFKIVMIIMFFALSMSLTAQEPDGAGAHQGATFTGVIKGGEPGKDSISVSFVNNLAVDFYHQEFYVHPDKNGIFRFRLSPINDLGIGSIALVLSGRNHAPISPGGIVTNYYVENDDNIFLEITIPKEGEVQHSFSGKGADKYFAMQSVFSVPFVRDDFPKHYYEEVNESKIHIGRLIKRCQLKVNTMRGILKYYKERLSPTIYDLLEVDILGKEYANLMANASFYYWRERYELLDKVFFNHLNEVDFPDEDILASSSHYIRYIIQKTILGLRIKYHSSDYNISDVYDVLKVRQNSLFRDKLITQYLYHQPYRLSEQPIATMMEKKRSTGHPYNTSYEAIVWNAFQSQVQDPGLKEVLKSIYEQYKKGADAYNFALPDINGNIVKLSDFRGKVVLMDLYSPGCTGCVRFAERLKKTIIPEFKCNTEVQFVAISFFPDKEKWIQDLEESDRNASLEHQVCLWAGGSPNGKLFAEHYQISLFPTFFLIDKDGQIFNSSNDGLTLSRSDDEIIDMIYNALDDDN